MGNYLALEQSVAGNYTCSASNLYGDDSITYSLVVVMPPRAPALELQYTTIDSIKFNWNHPDNGGANIQGKDQLVILKSKSKFFLLKYFRIRFELQER